MQMWLRLGVAFSLLALPAGSLGATFPCTHTGIKDAVQTGGGPHVLDCTRADTITVPGPGGLAIAGDLILDLRGVTIEFESIARAGIYIAPSVDCTSGCILGPTTAQLSNFTLRGGVTITTSSAFSPPGSVDATIDAAFIGAPANTIGGISVTGANTFLHLIDSTLDGNRTGIRVGGLFLMMDPMGRKRRSSVRWSRTQPQVASQWLSIRTCGS